MSIEQASHDVISKVPRGKSVLIPIRKWI